MDGVRPERREYPRERLAVSVTVSGGMPALTRDISAGGMYVVIAGRHEPKRHLAVALELPEVAMTFRASGRVMRVEHGADWTGVAVRFLDLQLRPAGPVTPRFA